MTQPFLLIHHPPRTLPETSRGYNLGILAAVMRLDEAEVRAMLDEHGRVDTDAYTLIPEAP